MPQIVFLDTNVILDYLENRNQEVRDIIAQLLLLHKKGKIILATSIFNIAELIDKEFEIHFMVRCIDERLSGDEILKKLKSDRKFYKKVAEMNKEKIRKQIENFLFKNEIKILTLSFEKEKEYEELYKLIYDYQLRTQDALIVATALINGATYFLSNDDELVNTISDLINSFDLRNKIQLESFRDNVVEAI